MTVTGGATWQQTTDNAYAGNNWTRMDASNLILDNGTYKRTGQEPGGDGGGALILGTWSADDNFARLGNLAKINVQIKNGGALINDGQVWFGSQEDQPTGLRASITINNGSMDLTGGTISQNNDYFLSVADLAFTYDYDEVAGAPKKERYEINFTGPGSITVDQAGIKVYTQDSSSLWNTGDPAKTYLELWNAGILKANGLSGATGATFGDFFTTTGTAGADNYTLTATSNTTLATVKWVGGASGEWNQANAWLNQKTSVTGNATAIFSQTNGSDGMNDNNPANTRARNIIIDGGAVVEYRANLTGDFRLKQGSSMTVTGGATWQQTTDNAYAGNNWTRMDASNLILDNGTYKRTGQEPGGDGGGALILGTWSADDNFARLGPNAQINVEIKNGGKLINDGQVWFGSQEDQPTGLEVSININNGSMDLTGGTISQNNDYFLSVADLAFTYDYDEVAGAPKNEKYEINFTGPGSITVDQAGIKVYTQDSSSLWNTGDPAKSYLDLWNLGILKANGLSGLTGADFNTFFSVTGTPGTDNYILNSLIEGSSVSLSGDYNSDGKVDAADYVLWRDNPAAHGGAGGYDTWKANFGATAGAGAGLGAGAVPEPTSLVLLLMGLASLGFRRR
jgi:hypothetical protein